jgi:hypothetical protein
MDGRNFLQNHEERLHLLMHSNSRVKDLIRIIKQNSPIQDENLSLYRVVSSNYNRKQEFKIIRRNDYGKHLFPYTDSTEEVIFVRFSNIPERQRPENLN